jgi:tRNA(Ile)-lysidine synthase
VVEHTTHNRAVAGSIPASATTSPVEAIVRSGLLSSSPRPRVLAAVSGGPDSTGLLLALRDLGHAVVAAHFDHALRAGSEQDADHVARLCRELQVGLVLERRTAPLGKGSLQAAAREARHEFLERARVGAGCDLIATAHTADDLAETVVMNILRGAGTRGLRGIPARNGAVVRPLLGASRVAIETYLQGKEVAGRDDPSNRDLRFLRARVRHLLMPAVPRLGPALIRTAGLAIAVEDRLSLLSSDGGANAEPAARRAALHRLYIDAGGRRPGLGRAHLEAMDRLLLDRRTGAALSLPGRLTFCVLPGGRPAFTSDRAVDPQQPADLQVFERPCAGCADPDAAHLRPGTLSLGTRRPGLRLRPRDGRGTRKLQDLFVDAKVPRHERDHRPLVFLDGELAWVPGIAVDEVRSTPKSEPGRHVWVGRSSTSPMVRSVN